MFFQLEVDANTLVHQLNKSASDMPNAAMTRWMAWIHLFDFNVVHVPGKRHTAPDALSRKPINPKDLEEMNDEEDVDEMIDGAFFQVFCVNAFATREIESDDPDLDGTYSRESINIALILTKLRKLEGISHSEYRRLKRKSRLFCVKDRLLFRQERVGGPMQRVIDDPEARERIIKACHLELGHRGAEGTYDLIRRRWWWDGVYSQVALRVRQCPACNLRNGYQVPGPMTVPKSLTVGQRWYVDGLHVTGNLSLMVAREGLSRWPEARVFKMAAKNITSHQIAKFI